MSTTKQGVVSGDVNNKGKSVVGIDKIHQILIRLTSPLVGGEGGEKGVGRNNNKSKPKGRRSCGIGVNSGGATINAVQCDGAIWSSDDTKIITSQTCQLKATSPEIVPGSHVLYVWDSHTGQCLLRIYNAHSLPCPVLVSHPSDPTILVSLGGDGYIKFWDLDTCQCMFSHHNTVDYGPVDPPTNRGKVSAFLDGAFCPNGLNFICSDDSGRITLVDVILSEHKVKEGGQKDSNYSAVTSSTLAGVKEQDVIVPNWMKEQYFANDYYELQYDSHGYCIERGSEQPPHLAPRGARCAHTGVPYPDSWVHKFRQISGPDPLSERNVRINRDKIRCQSYKIRKMDGIQARNVQRFKRVVTTTQSDSNPNFRGNLSMTGSIHKSFQPSNSNRIRDSNSSQVITARRENNSGSTTQNSIERALNPNYRWRDYDDVLEEEKHNIEEEIDRDDEDYQEGLAVGYTSSDSYDSNSYGDMIDIDRRSQRVREREVRRNQEQSNSLARSSRQKNRRRKKKEIKKVEEVITTKPTRVSKRRIKGSFKQYCDSDDNEVEEMISCNTKPPVDDDKDYTDSNHFWKMPEGPLHRKWARRVECILGNIGEKMYAPQVGDSVVYIAKAHYKAFESFPTGSQSQSSHPWKLWSSTNSWPVVRCTINNIRYRFPYEHFYGRRSQQE